MQPIKPIRNEADVDLALQEIGRCLDAAAGSPVREQPEVLTVLVDDDEARHHPIRSGEG
jgi:antitoxin component HigA of HigAB toxin-antitoxin module